MDKADVVKMVRIVAKQAEYLRSWLETQKGIIGERKPAFNAIDQIFFEADRAYRSLTASRIGATGKGERL